MVIKMIIIDRNRAFFKTRQIWFSDAIYDISSYDNVVFSGCKNECYAPGFVHETHMTSVINLTQSLDDIWGNMKKSCRNSIKRSERDGIKVKINQNYDEFYEIYKVFIKNRGIGPQEGLDTIKKYGTLFIAEYEGEVLGGHVYLEDENTIMYWISATKRAESDRDRKVLIGNASHLIHWEAINYSKQNSIKEFDMGGLFAGQGNNYLGHSIDEFKESFGGIRTIKHLYYKNSRNYELAKKAYKNYKISKTVYSLLLSKLNVKNITK
jgi:lipid II:glycine glycyltransferase (peptidoglycan interpeptide bridge formation enzyme)